MRGPRTLCSTLTACALILVCARPGAAATVIDFDVVDPDVRFPGNAEEDRSGQTVLLADIDGNGRDDMIIAAPNADFSGRVNCGTVYVYLSTGPLLTGTIELGGASPNLLRVHGPAGGSALGTVIACGDVNNDSRDDILIGIPGETVNGKFSAGHVYVILGSATPPAELDLALPNALVTEIQGANIFDKLGTSIAVGNVNDDDFGDIIMGAPFATAPAGSFAGKIFVVPGAASFADTIDLATPPLNVTQINGANTNDTFGTACYAADVNDDSIDDIIAGAPQATVLGRASAGAAYIVPGSATLATTIDVSDGAAAGIIKIMGPEANGLAGSRFCAADMNGDMIDDLILAAPEMNALGRASAGAVFILDGTNAWPDSIDLAGGGISRIEGPAANVKIGLTLDIGDLNVDGLQDLIIGSPLSTPFVGRDEAGIAFVVFGRSVFQPSVDLAVTQAGVTKVYGATKNDHLGRSVAIGTIDNDAFADLLLGADNVPIDKSLPNDPPDMVPAVGESYIVYGSAAITPTRLLFYRASGGDDGVHIEWILADDVPADVMTVRREHQGRTSMVPVTRITRTSERRYHLDDGDVSAGDEYLYTVGIGGDESQILFTTTVRVPAAATTILRLRAHPNPSRGLASIEFVLPRSGHANVAVFDVTGARVTTLADDVFPGGANQTSWNGTTRTGADAASGVYFIRLHFGGRLTLHKLLLVR